MGHVHDRVHGTYTCTEPCTRQCVQHTAVYTGPVHCHQWTRPMYTAVWYVHTAVYTCRIHGRIRAVYMVVFTAMYGPCTRWPYTPPCTRPSLRPIYMAEHTGRKDVYTARVHGRIHGLLHMYSTGTRVLDRVHGRVQAVDRRTRPVQAAYTVCTRPCICRIHGPKTRPSTRTRPCSRPCAPPVNGRAHGRVHVYTAVFTPSVRPYRPCTRAINTAVYTAV